MVNLTLENISKKLTEDIINQAFKVKSRSHDNMNSIEISRAAPAGAGLLGAVYRIHVVGKTHEAFFIAKGLFKDPILKKSLDTSKYFKREIMFFSQVLPALAEEQKLAGAKERIQDNVPVCYAYHCDGENDFILMEDLRDSQCEPVGKYPSKHERDEILKALAHLHAVSFNLRAKKPEQFARIINNIPEQYYTEADRKRYTPFLQNAIDLDFLALSEYENPNSSLYYKKFEQLVHEDPYGQVIQLTSDWSDHPTISHGDAWTPNFLVSTRKAMAIDFQLLRCTSPASDLSFLIILTSCQDGNKEYARNGIRVYYEAFSYYLRDMSIDANVVFPREKLDIHLQKYGRFGMFAAASTIPLMLSEKCDVLQDFEKNYDGLQNIPLDKLWHLRPYETKEEKMMLVNAVKISVDLGFI